MSPRRVVADYLMETQLAREEIQAAREILPNVSLPEDVAHLGLGLTSRLKLDSLRAEITLFEAARAYAAADARAACTSVRFAGRSADGFTLAPVRIHKRVF